MIKLISIIQFLMFSYTAYSFQYPASLLDTRINVGDHELHIVCQGQGKPTVILEAGSGTDLSTWSIVQPEIAKFARVCTYSRAGLGKSSIPNNKTQLDAVQTTQDLHTLLSNPLIRTNSPPPYVLVGHSYGGLYVRNFLELYPQEVAGMVLIEATSGTMTMKDYGFSDELVNALIVVNQKKDAYFKRHPEVSEEELKTVKPNQELITKIKAQSVPNNLIRSINCLRQLEFNDMARLDKMNRKHPHFLGSKPLVVIITEQNEMIDLVSHYRVLKNFVSAVINDDQRDAFSAIFKLDFTKPIALAEVEKTNMLSLSTNSTLKIVKQSGHNIHLDQPKIVIDSIKNVVLTLKGQL
ncbi:alpha/beta hydrolase [Legionella sp. 16cNR16C]|uniref:alpha/beta hydrolase n=1 Tax=Legionella sp. 16cNR16C TaxID=2905656 RepID=UPI001E60526B|nr:alpha/beta hydrolase [Legionella sp. 16cNR16C]MCE3043709.1 alpha/beta hydrolase [Legionella sp. 16cNR16C]